ncbi:MAG: aconitase X swivel domain-containing protein, partial [Pseudonocardiaceae bacterium]
SSSSSVLAEQIRSGVSPSAIVLSEVDAIIVLGTIVAAELYDKHIPVIMVARAVIDSLTNDLLVEVVASAGGAAGLRVLESPEPAPSCGAPQEQEETTR